MEKMYDFATTCRCCLKERPNMQCLFDALIPAEEPVKIIDFIDKMTSITVNDQKLHISYHVFMIFFYRRCNVVNYQKVYVTFV